MSKNTKHTNKMRKHYRKFVEKCGGTYIIIGKRSGMKDIYIIGPKKRSHKWHSSPSTSNVVNCKNSDLNRMSRELGVETEWRDYKNENTISMSAGSFGIMFK